MLDVKKHLKIVSWLTAEKITRKIVTLPVNPLHFIYEIYFGIFKIF